MLKENYQRVKDLLITNPETRDNDNLLLSMIWRDDLANYNGNPVNAYMPVNNFLDLLANNELTNFESVRRVRQKIQEECPELRGVKYRVRCGRLELETKQEVKELSFHGRFGEKESIIKEGDLFRE